MPFALVAGTLAIPAALASAGGASAAAWLPVQDLPTVPSDIAVDADGDAVVVGLGTDRVIRATDRRFGVPWWTAPVVLEGTGDTLPSRPKVTVDGDGNAVAVWSATNAGKRLLRVASRPAGGAWSTPAKLSDQPTPWVDSFALATDRQGTTTVAWAELENSSGVNYVLRTLTRPARGSWPGSATKVWLTTSSDDVRAPSVAVGDRGRVTVAWVGVETAPGGFGVVDVIRSRSRSGAPVEWSDAKQLSTGSAASTMGTPDVASDTDGNATVAWAQDGTVRVSRRPVGGSWTAAPGIALGSGTEPQLAAAADETVTAVWTAPEDGGSAIRTRTSSDRGVSWAASNDLAWSEDPGDVSYPQIAAPTRGDVTAIWGRFNGSQATAEVARRVDGIWRDEPDQAVGPLATHPVGAIDRNGHVTLAWTGATALPGASAVFDPAAPELLDLVVPTTGVVGEPVDVSVDPLDASPVTTTWNLGGTTSSGVTASRTFDTPGVFTITVRSEDEAGNVAESSTPITIATRPVKSFPPPPDAVPDPKPAPAAPVMSGLQQTSVRWTTKKRRGSRVPVGTSFRFRLDRAAKVRLDFGQIVPGRRSGKSCVKATKKNRSKRSCDRVEARGTVNVVGQAGTNRVGFRGKVGRRTLKPGRYRVRVTASADGKTSKAVTKTFTIVR